MRAELDALRATGWRGISTTGAASGTIGARAGGRRLRHREAAWNLLGPLGGPALSARSGGPGDSRQGGDSPTGARTCPLRRAYARARRRGRPARHDARRAGHRARASPGRRRSPTQEERGKAATPPRKRYGTVELAGDGGLGAPAGAGARAAEARGHRLCALSERRARPGPQQTTRWASWPSTGAPRRWRAPLYARSAPDGAELCGDWASCRRPTPPRNLRSRGAPRQRARAPPASSPRSRSRASTPCADMQESFRRQRPRAPRDLPALGGRQRATCGRS